MRIIMENSNVLIGTAMLTAIWDQTHKDNLELLKPFVIYILGKENTIGQEIDIQKIIQEMENKFGFSKIPKAVILKIFNRMKNVIIKKNKKFFLIKDLSSEYEKFEKHKEIIQQESNSVINCLMNYLKLSNRNFKKITFEETQKLFEKFLEQNGFITIENVGELKNIQKYKTEQSNYFIGKFILSESEKDSKIFKDIYKIVCGFMLANTIYIQVENDNKASLKKLDCYLDTPLLLNLLGFKTEEQNNSTKLLVELLEKKKAKIKCFRHNYDEVFSIVNAYKENIGRYREKTLEGLDLKKYTYTDVERILDNLYNLFKNKHIEVVETPAYENSQLSIDKKYEAIIDESALKSFLLEKYADRNEKKEKVLDPDIASISAIARIRENKKYKKIEECKAIFITSSYDLIKYSNMFFNIKEFEEISYCISDVEITTILWLKTFKTNPELPKLKLIENARLSLEPTNNMMERFKDVIEKLKKEELINDADVLENLKTNLYYKTELMEKTDGDSDNITDEIVKGIIDKKTENLQVELNVANEKINSLEKKNLENEIKKKKVLQNIENACKKRAIKLSEVIGKSIKGLIYAAFILCFIYSCYITFFDIIIGKEKIELGNVILLAISIIGIIDMFFPRLNFIIKKLKNNQNKIEEYLYNRLLKKELDKIKDLYD